MAYPIFAIIFGHVIGVFSETNTQELRAGGNRYAFYVFLVAVVMAIAVFFQNYCFNAAAERLSSVLRLRSFDTILKQDIAYFDEEENSTGALTSNIASHSQNVNGLAGVTLGAIVQALVTILGGSVVGLSYGWRVSVVGIACIPLTLSAGAVRLRVVMLNDIKTKNAHSRSAQVACEAAGAIRTGEQLLICYFVDST